MWQVDVPLGEFYRAIVEAGRRADYLALLTALVREADSEAFYKDVSRYWSSLHDLTGPDVLFVLAGPNASREVQYHGEPDGREPVAYRAKSMAVVSDQENPLRPRLGRWAARARSGTSAAPDADELAYAQTLAVGELRRELGLSEASLPCLHVSFLGYSGRSMGRIVPLSTDTVYNTVKSLVSSLDDDFAEIRELTERLKRYERALDRRPRRFRHSQSVNRSSWSPEESEAEHKIFAICDSAPSTADELALARKECFHQAAVFKGNPYFQFLQHHIDINLDPNHSSGLGAKTALDSVWKRVSSFTDSTTGTRNNWTLDYEIFIAYDSKHRWIAERLHTALERHAPTFIDVRCVRPGDRWTDRIRKAQDNARITVLLVGDPEASSWYQEAEYLRAIELVRSEKQRIIPVYTKGAPDSTPYGLDGVQGIETTWASGLRDAEVDKVAAEIAALLPARQEKQNKRMESNG